MAAPPRVARRGRRGDERLSVACGCASHVLPRVSAASRRHRIRRAEFRVSSSAGWSESPTSRGRGWSSSSVRARAEPRRRSCVHCRLTGDCSPSRSIGGSPAAVLLRRSAPDRARWRRGRVGRRAGGSGPVRSGCRAVRHSVLDDVRRRGSPDPAQRLAGVGARGSLCRLSVSRRGGSIWAGRSSAPPKSGSKCATYRRCASTAGASRPRPTSFARGIDPGQFAPARLGYAESAIDEADPGGRCQPETGECGHDRTHYAADTAIGARFAGATKRRRG